MPPSLAGVSVGRGLGVGKWTFLFPELLGAFSFLKISSLQLDEASDVEPRDIEGWPHCLLMSGVILNCVSLCIILLLLPSRFFSLSSVLSAQSLMYLCVILRAGEGISCICHL